MNTMPERPDPEYNPELPPMLDSEGAPVWSAQQLPDTTEHQWYAARKTALTPVVRIHGPATIDTQEGRWQLSPAWEGYLAVDRAGYPYPIEAAEFGRTYEISHAVTGPCEVTS